MLLVREVIGHESDGRFAGRRVERLPVRAAEAGRRRLRATTEAGTDVAVDVTRGSYLAHGAVLDDDGLRIVVVDRTPEEAAIVRLRPGLEPPELIASAVRLGHVFGNQHAPVEVEDGVVLIPVTTSRALVEETISSLGIDAEVEFGLVRLGCHAPLEGPAHLH